MLVLNATCVTNASHQVPQISKFDGVMDDDKESITEWLEQFEFDGVCNWECCHKIKR